MNCLKPALLALVTASMLALPLASVSHRAMADEPKKTEEKVKKSELNNQMEDMDDAMKKLRRSIRKADQNEASLKLLAEIQEKAVACKSMTPTKTEKLPEADRAKFVLAYRKEMAAVIIDLCQMEQALLDGDNAKAQEIYKAIGVREDKDHDQFMQKDEKKKK
jgi:translation initiation factor 2B subunit (eIF-2B alpha/beta/delta family)